MTAGRIGIFILAVLIVLGASTSVRADHSLCTRVMVFVARARGDATGEFKRRIAFLLETGKIGEEHLARMLASETAVSPFEDGHLTADIVPHAAAVDRLVQDKSVNWEKVRGFARDLQGKLERSRGERAVHEAKTKTVLYPYVVRTVKTTGWVSSSPVVFKRDGKSYVVAKSDRDKIIVVEAPSGRKVSEVVASADTLPGVVFAQNGRDYMINVTVAGEFYVWAALTGRLVRTFQVGAISELRLTAFAEGGRNYVVTSTNMGIVYVNDALTGDKVAQIPKDRSAGMEPVVFEENGKVYLLTGSTESILVSEAVGGRRVRRIKMPNGAPETPLLFKHDGKTCFVEAAGDGNVYVHEAVSGKRLKAIPIASTYTIGNFTILDPLVFEEGGQTYLGLICTGELLVFNVLTGEMVTKVTFKQLKDDRLSTLQLLQHGGKSYLASAGLKQRLYVFEALTGVPVAQMKVGGENDAYQRLVEQGGVLYFSRALDDGYFYLDEALTGRSIGKIKIPGGKFVQSDIFEQGGRLFTAVASDNHRIYIIQLHGPLLKKRE